MAIANKTDLFAFSLSHYGIYSLLYMYFHSAWCAIFLIFVIYWVFNFIYDTAVLTLEVRFAVILQILIAKITEVGHTKDRFGLLIDEQHLYTQIINLLGKPNHTGIPELVEHTALALDGSVDVRRVNNLSSGVMTLGILLHGTNDMHIRILLVDNLLFVGGNCNHLLALVDKHDYDIILPL